MVLLVVLYCTSCDHYLIFPLASTEELIWIMGHLFDLGRGSYNVVYVIINVFLVTIEKMFISSHIQVTSSNGNAKFGVCFGHV